MFRWAFIRPPVCVYWVRNWRVRVRKEGHCKKPPTSRIVEHVNTFNEPEYVQQIEESDRQSETSKKLVCALVSIFEEVVLHMKFLWDGVLDLPQLCSGTSPASAFRGDPWWCSGNYLGCWRSNQILLQTSACKASACLPVLSPQP